METQRCDVSFTSFNASDERPVQSGRFSPSSDAPLDPSEGIACIAFVIYLPGLIAAWIGMWFLRDWSRWLYFVLTILGHIFSLGSGLVDFSASWHFPEAVGSVGTPSAASLSALCSCRRWRRNSAATASAVRVQHQ
jgi:hypothetical protein